MTDQPKKTVKITAQEEAQLFANEYQALCERHGYQIVVMPVYIARDDGTFSTKLNTSVGKLPKRE